MTGLQELINAKCPARALQEGEYVNAEDGLIYCSACHTPRQTRVTILGRTMTPFVPCRCEQERQEAEKAKQARIEHMERIARMKASGLQDRALRDYNFANDLGYNTEIAKAHAYVERFAEMEASSTGLLLWGDVGTGKSFFAGCIANALIERGIPVLMTNFARILNTLTGMYAEDRNHFIDSFENYRLLVLDDLGMERGTEFALEQVFNVIDSRYRSKKPMIVTTNLTLAELKQPADLVRRRIFGRVLERCVPLKLNRLDIRAEKAVSQMRAAQTLLCDETNQNNE